MKYKTLMVGTIALGALSIASAKDVEKTESITTSSSATKNNLKGDLNSRYGKVKFVNRDIQTDYIIEPDNSASKHGVFLDADPVTVKPGKSHVFTFQMDYGVQVAADASANVHCESSGSADGGGFDLIVAGGVARHYSVKAACTAATLSAEAHPVLKVSKIVHKKNDKKCTATVVNYSMNVNPKTHSVVVAHTHINNGGQYAGHGRTTTTNLAPAYITHNNFEPKVDILDFDAEVTIYSPTASKKDVIQCD